MDYNNLNNFAKDLVLQAGYDDVPDQYREDYSRRLARKMVRRLSICLLDGVDFETIKKIEEELEEKQLSTDEGLAVFSKYIPDFDKKKNAILDEFRQEYLDFAKTLSNKKT